MTRETIARKKYRADFLKETKPKLRHYQYKMLIYIKKGNYARSISRQMKMPESTVKDRIYRLLELGLIKEDVKTTATFYKLTKKGYEAVKTFECRLSRYPRQKIKTRMHRLNIKFKIIKDNDTAKFDREYELNNWIQRFITVKFPIGLTIKKTSKSIIAMFHEFETDNSRTIDDFFNHVMRGIQYTYYYCLKKLGIEIDVFEPKVLDQHIVNERPDLAGKIEEGKTTTLDLQRRAKSYFKTDIKAKAWIDHSRGTPEIETNDFLYQEKLLAMPEKIDLIENNLLPVIHDLTRQMALHLQVMEDMRDSLKEMKGYFKERRKGH